MNFPKLFLLVNIDEAIKYSERRLKEKAVKPRSGLSLQKFSGFSQALFQKLGHTHRQVHFLAHHPVHRPAHRLAHRPVHRLVHRLVHRPVHC